MRVVATAGHVDHGKSALVRALTGSEPDRFPEERARGLTIDLGFAFADLPSGTAVGFVDVPGHVRFAKNMLAGVGAVDAALLVVGADEGWMPQSEEHLLVLELLGIEVGVVALAKADVVDEEALGLARLEVTERLATGAAGRWPVVAVDSISGRGVLDVAAALDAVLGAAPPAPDHERPRLWVDRVFAPRGVGTVVTGTLTGGGLAVDDVVAVEPHGRPVRVRGIQSRHASAERAAPGARVALNLAGIDHHEVGRGDAVVRPDEWVVTGVVDVALRRVPGVAVPRRAHLHVHVGAAEREATVRTLDADGRFARLRFAPPLPLAPGDRMVLRSSARQAVVGGAEVLDVEPARRTVDALARLPLPPAERVLAGRPWLTVADLGPRTGTGRPDVIADRLVAEGRAARVGGWLVAAGVLARLETAAREHVARHHRQHPLDRGVDAAELGAALGLDAARTRTVIERTAGLVLDGGVVRDPGWEAVPDVDPDAARLLDALAATPFTPPSPADLGVPPPLVRALVRSGLVVDLDGILMTPEALDRASAVIARAVVERGTLTVAQTRDLLGSTRRVVLPILQRTDRAGITRRRGDVRVAGPRAAR